MQKLSVPLLCALALALTAVGTAASAPGFSPKLIAGNWTGTWMNETFGSTGSASIVAKATRTTLAFTADFGGNVFGCPDPNPESTKPLTKGAGPNHWNPSGFKIKGVSKAFGTLQLIYTHATKRLKGGGSNPNCAMNLAWVVDGTFAGNTFTGTVNITLPDGSKAVSKINLTRA